MNHDIQDDSGCQEGEERYKYFKSWSGRWCLSYGYRADDGELYTTVARDLKEARWFRDQWLKKKERKQ